MRFQPERLEGRNLFAADVQLSYEPGTDEPNELGEVTRQFRVFTDEATEILVTSSISDEFDDARWVRTSGFSNRIMGRDFLPEVSDFRIEGGKRLLQSVGDLNSDGREEFVLDLGERVLLVHGDLTDGIARHDQAGVTWITTRHPVPEHGFAPSTFVPLGDIDGDGFDDLQINLRYRSGDAWITRRRILWGAEQLPPETSLRGLPSFPSASAIGDVNGDKINDVFVATDNRRFVLFGSPELRNVEISPAERVANGGGIELLASSSRAQFGNIASVGDLNADGFGDFMLGGDPYIIYGGPTLTARASFDVDTMEANAGFYVGRGGVNLTVGAGLLFAEVGGVGDVNGDGLDDVLVSYDGGECGACTATDEESIEFIGGGLILYGGESVGSTGTFDPTTEPHTSVRISSVGYASSHAELHDVNGDGLHDIHLSNGPQGRKQVVIAGRSGSIPNLDFGLESECCGDMLDGETVFAFAQPPRSFRPVDYHSFWYEDINSDGIADAIASRHSDPGLRVFLGKKLGEPIDQGEGDISEVIQLAKNESAIFTITGTPKENATLVNTTAVPVDRSDHNLSNNVSLPESAVSLSLSMEAPQTTRVGEVFTATLNVTNSGPSKAEAAQITDSLFGLTNVEWTRSESVFPADIDLAETALGFGAAVHAPENIRFRLFHPPFLSSDILYEGLGNGLIAKDFNEDGFDDLLVRVESSQEPAGCPRDCSRGARFIAFAGNAAFGANGQLPPPYSGSTRGGTRATADGDFNGDGLADTIVLDESDRLRAHLLFGNADETSGVVAELDGQNGFSIVSSTAEVSSLVLGDLNGDGLDDLIVGDRNPSGEDAMSEARRAVHVIYGRAEPIVDGILELDDIDGRNGFRIELQGSGPDSYTRVLSNFDVNGDGIEDLLIGDPMAGRKTGPWIDFEDSFSPGAAYVVMGRAASHEAFGTGPLDQTFDVNVQATIQFEIRGTIVGREVGGSLNVVPGPGQLELYPETNKAVLQADVDLASDFNDDGFVDFADFLILSVNFGKQASPEEGDVNEDTLVDLADFLILRQEFNAP